MRKRVRPALCVCVRACVRGCAPVGTLVCVLCVSVSRSVEDLACIWCGLRFVFGESPLWHHSCVLSVTP